MYIIIYRFQGVRAYGLGVRQKIARILGDSYQEVVLYPDGFKCHNMTIVLTKTSDT